MTRFTESEVEDAALEWLVGLGWTVAHGPDIAPGAPDAERADYGEVVLERRLRGALARLNPDLPDEALDDAFRKLIRPEGATLEVRNRAFHRLLTNGVALAFTARRPANRGLLFCLFTSAPFRDMLQSMVTGTSRSHQRAPPAALKRRDMLSGTPALLDRFGELVSPMLDSVIGSRTETRTLSVLRDALLPKLVSGDLRLDETIERPESAACPTYR